MKTKIYKKILIGILVTIFFIFYLSYIVRDKRNLSNIEMFLKDTFYLFTVHPVSKEVNLSKNFYEARIIEYDNEIESLKNLLNLNKSLSKYSLINATVLNRNVGYWYNTITIDKGKRNGIKVNNAVITDKGLIGVVVKTTFTTSTIKLFSNKENNLSVKIESDATSIYGILKKYDRKTNLYEIVGISGNDYIYENATIITTGLDGMPSGILIGYVKKVKTDNFELERTVFATPSINYDDIKYVAVLKDTE